jgi:hypothetical protein
MTTCTEETQTLRQRLHQEQHGRSNPRRPRRSRLACGHAPTRPDGAPWLGGHRQTVGHGRALDEAGGLAAWLAGSGPAGTAVSLPLAVMGGGAPAVRPLAGVAADEARRPWVTPRAQLAGRAPTRARPTEPPRPVRGGSPDERRGG